LAAYRKHIPPETITLKNSVAHRLVTAIVSQIAPMKMPSAHIPIRSGLTIFNWRLYAHDPRLIAIAPTTPIAYNCASVWTSRARIQTIAGRAHAPISPYHGTPKGLICERNSGSSRSRLMAYWMLIMATIAVLVADSSNRPKIMLATAANVLPTYLPATT
jgi:hypothetical protein